jgi:hypothetical protein
MHFKPMTIDMGEYGQICKVFFAKIFFVSVHIPKMVEQVMPIFNPKALY